VESMTLGRVRLLNGLSKAKLRDTHSLLLHKTIIRLCVGTLTLLYTAWVLEVTRYVGDDSQLCLTL